MNIGILTFHASHNYGSMLQAWALQTYLLSVGHNAEILNLRTQRQKRLYRYPISARLPFRRYEAFNSILSIFNPIWLYHECRKWHKYEHFLESELNLSSKCYSSWEEIKNDLAILGYDCLISGGDQIWNVRCKDFDTSYFLPGKLDGIKKYSYAPSFGGSLLSTISEKEKETIKFYLSDYDRVSVREESMQSFLSDLLNARIEQVVDPTLLLYASDYDRLMEKEPIIKGDYVYYYSPIHRSNAEELAKLLAKHFGMRIVTSSPGVFSKKGFYSAQESGPSEFLNLISNAAFVVGRSFHSVVFSLLFHKDFIAIDGAKDARMKDILTKCGVLDRGMVTIDNYKTLNLNSISYDNVDLILDNQRKASQSFIDSMFSPVV